MSVRRSLRALLVLACGLAAAGLGLTPSGSAATASECASPSQEPACEYGAHAQLETPTCTGTSTQPGAIVPPPADYPAEAEFAAHVKEWEERGKLAVSPQAWEARLTPGLEGGWIGWCLTVRAGADRATRCPVSPKQEGIGYESWEAGGSGTRGLALVTGSVEAVAVDDASNATATVPVTGVPGVSAALVEIPAPFPAKSSWFDEFESVLDDVRSSGGRGWSAPQRNYSTALPAAAWQAPASSPAGVCSLTPAHLRGLVPRFGHVATSLLPTPGIAGGGFASCIDIEYSFARSSLDAAVLLNAAEPAAAAPASLPNATPVRHHPGLFSAPGWNGQILARRVGEAWLAVEGGANLRQRIDVLSHLRVRVHAQPSA